MHVCMYVCMYIYIYIHVYIYICIYIHTHTYMCVCVYIYIYIWPKVRPADVPGAGGVGAKRALKQYSNGCLGGPYLGAPHVKLVCPYLALFSNSQIIIQL